MSRIRKRILLERAPAVPEIASEIAEALTDVAAALCYDAATKYEGTAGEQRQIAATMFRIAQKRFQGVRHEGEHIAEMDMPELAALWDRLITGRKRRS
jgi:hypothetical protein